jgi:drug/metabolite transporter (DMT)-like permease
MNNNCKNTKDKQIKATLIGSTAIVMWSTLALFSSFAKNIPPFQLTAMAFSIAAVIGMLFLIKTKNFEYLKQLKHIWVIGIGGLFGFHFFYFVALQNAPVIEASLITYLWPLLIILFSALLLKEKLKWFHILGIFCGMTGTVMLITKSLELSFKLEFLVGYLSALIAAVLWALYTVLSRKYGSVPTHVVGAFCAITAVLSFICHLLFENTAIPSFKNILAITALGIFPMGIAFFTWDYGIKHGNIKALSSLSYLAPLLSAVLLVIFGAAEFSYKIAVACILITGGAFLASLEFFKKF